MLLTPRTLAMCLILLWGVAHCLQVQTVPAPTVTGNFKTVYGKEYKDATVSRIEPDGILLTTKSGISKVYFVELPKEVQERFHYDAAKAAQFTTVEQSAVEQLNAVTAAEQQQQAEERQRQLAAIVQQEQQARDQQRQAEAIAEQQQQQQFQAQQRSEAKIAAQKQARQQTSKESEQLNCRAIRARAQDDREAERQQIQYQINNIQMDRMVKPLSKEEQQTLRTLEHERDSIPH